MPTTSEKHECLDHYARLNKPHLFQQYDGFCDFQLGDAVMGDGDADGDTIFATQTWELMTGGTNVRVLINTRTTVEEALRLLGKIADSIRDRGWWAIVENVPIPDEFE